MRQKEVSQCPECNEDIEDGQERTVRGGAGRCAVPTAHSLLAQIVSGTEWHKWCFQKFQGEQKVEAKLDLTEVCPACDEAIEEGQEKSIIRGKEWHKHCFEAIKAQMAPKKSSAGKKKKKKKAAPKAAAEDDE